MNLEEILGSTGIILPDKRTRETPVYAQARPAKPIKELDSYPHYFNQNESQEDAKARYFKEQIAAHNYRAKRVNQIDAFVARCPNTNDPYLYVIFPQIKRVKKPKKGGREYNASPTNLIFVAILMKGHQDEGNVWYNQEGQLVVRFPIGERSFSTIPLYEEQT